MWYVLYSLIILSTILVLPVHESYWLPKNAVFIILGISLVGSSWLMRPKERTNFYSPWLSFILIGFALHFGWFFLRPLVVANARGETLWNFFVIFPSINVFLGIMMIYTLVEYTDSFQRWIGVAKVICWLGFGLSIYAILQHFKLDQIFQHTTKLHENNVCMFFGNPMLAGNFLAMISPLALMFKKLKYIGIYVLMAIATVLAGSEASMAIFLIGLIVFLALTGKWKISLLITFLAIIAFVLALNHCPDRITLKQRPMLWKETIKLCKEAPYTGTGLGSFFSRKLYPNPKVDSWAHTAHSEPLEIWHDCGILGLGVVICYLISLFWRLLFIEKSMMLVSYLTGFLCWLLIALIAFPLRIAPLALIGVLYISCLEVHCSRVRKT